MKSTVLIAAMLSGLCAGAVASPITRITDDPPTGTVFDDAFAAPVIERDLNFYNGSIREAFLAGAPTQSNGGPSALDLNETSDSLRLPEPPPLATIALGLGCLGTLALLRRSRNQKRVASLRLIRMPLRQNGERDRSLSRFPHQSQRSFISPV